MEHAGHALASPTQETVVNNVYILLSIMSVLPCKQIANFFTQITFVLHREFMLKLREITIFCYSVLL